VSGDAVHQPRWPLLLKIEHMVKLQVFGNNSKRVFIFCFHFQQFKNITQTSSILLFWQTNNTIVFTLSTGRIVPGNICLERNYIKTDEDSVFNHAKHTVHITISEEERAMCEYRHNKLTGDHLVNQAKACDIPVSHVIYV
jgi:hypothetical protein